MMNWSPKSEGEEEPSGSTISEVEVACSAASTISEVEVAHSASTISVQAAVDSNSTMEICRWRRRQVDVVSAVSMTFYHSRP
jgi:hypothetical protein